MVLCVFDPSTQEAEADGPLWIWGQSGLHSDFQDSQSYIVRLYLEEKTNKQENQNKQTNKKQKIKNKKVSASNKAYSKRGS